MIVTNNEQISIRNNFQIEVKLLETKTYLFSKKFMSSGNKFYCLIIINFNYVCISLLAYINLNNLLTKLL